MPRLRLILALVFVITIASLASGQADPAKLAPETAVLYAEISNPAPLLDIALAAKTRKLLENAEGYQKYVRSDQYQQLQTVVGLLETRLGKNWEQLVRDVLGGGIAVCFDPPSNAGFLAIRSHDRNLLDQFHSAVAELIEADAKQHGRASPVKSKEYEGFTGWTFGGDEVHVIVDDLLLVSNNKEVLKGAIDRHRNPAAANLASTSDFSQARSKRPAGAIGWSWVNLAAVRQDPNVQKGLAKRSDNPVAELLLAGVIDTLKQSPSLTSSLSFDASSIKFRAELPRQPSTTAATRAWFFAAADNETAVTPPGTIGTFALFRNLAGLWLARDELFDETIVAQFAQADTNLGLFFSGRDFGPEVLGELETPVQLVVARQEYPADKPTPALKLPAFGLVLKLKHADDFAPELLMAYQKLIGIVNITGAQQGKPQLLLSTEEYQGATISKASYLHNAKVPKENAPPHYNFSPACARIGDHFVFASTVGLVRQTVDALKPGSPPVTLKDNSALTIDAAALAAILDDNKELLTTQNMLKEAHNRTEAETAVQTLLDALRQMKRLTLRISDEPGMLALESIFELPASR